MTASSGGMITEKKQLADVLFRNERHIVFPKMLAQNCRDFSNTNTMYNKVEHYNLEKLLYSKDVDDF